MTSAILYAPIICNHAAPVGPGNSGDFNSSQCKAPINALHCGAMFTVKKKKKKKKLPKAPLKFRQVNVKMFPGVQTWNQRSAVTKHWDKNTVLKPRSIRARPPRGRAYEWLVHNARISLVKMSAVFKLSILFWMTNSYFCFHFLKNKWLFRRDLHVFVVNLHLSRAMRKRVFGSFRPGQTKTGLLSYRS